MLFQESPFPSATALPCSHPSRKHSLYRLCLHFILNYLFNPLHFNFSHASQTEKKVTSSLCSTSQEHMIHGLLFLPWNTFFSSGFQSTVTFWCFSFLPGLLHLCYCLLCSSTAKLWKVSELCAQSSDLFFIYTHFPEGLDPFHGFKYHLYSDAYQIFISSPEHFSELYANFSNRHLRLNKAMQSSSHASSPFFCFHK